MSSKNLIPLHVSDDITFGIVKRVLLFLTNNVIHFDDIALEKIIDNVFKMSTETKRLHLQFQQMLTLLQSPKLSSNAKIGEVLWCKVANHIQDSLSANIDAHKEVVYDYIEWVVKHSKIDQVSEINYDCITDFDSMFSFQSYPYCCRHGRTWLVCCSTTTRMAFSGSALQRYFVLLSMKPIPEFINLSPQFSNLLNQLVSKLQLLSVIR